MEFLNTNKPNSVNVIVPFASKRHNALSFPYLKENRELLSVITTTSLSIDQAQLALYREFYLQAMKFTKFFPQYYRFTLGMTLELEILGMEGNVSEEICNYITTHDLYQFETSDLRRLEILNLLDRRNFGSSLKNTYGEALEIRIMEFMSSPLRFVKYNKPFFYELTHYIFYLTNYGKTQPYLPKGVFKSLSNVGNLALLDNDIDLLSEICICYRFLGRSPPAYWEQFIQSSACDFIITYEKNTNPNNIKLADNYHDYLMLNWYLAYSGKPAFTHSFSNSTPYFYKPTHGRSALSELSAAHYAHSFGQNLLPNFVQQDISTVLSETNGNMIKQLTKTTPASRELIHNYCDGLFSI